MKQVILTVAMALSLIACGGASVRESSDTQVEIVLTISQQQKNIMDQIISVFENNTPVIQYAYAENLDDGRGITAGRAGFTSATGDMLEVIQRYTQLVTLNPLAPYLPRLMELAADEDGSTNGLEGLPDKWQISAEDEKFRGIQDQVSDEFYYAPAVQYATSLGAVYPLTLLNLYDAAVQHGDGEDPDGLAALVRRTSNNLGGSPKEGIDEALWLSEFMSVRRSVLLKPYNQDTQQEWSESVGRIDSLIKISQDDNFWLKPPIEIGTWGDLFIIN